jgi:hypothetical protein
MIRRRHPAGDALTGLDLVIFITFLIVTAVLLAFPNGSPQNRTGYESGRILPHPR